MNGLQRKLPRISGDKLISFLTRIGYEVIRQRGSHVRLRLERKGMVFHVTIPRHKEIAKGTLTRILRAVSLQTGIALEELIKHLR